MGPGLPWTSVPQVPPPAQSCRRAARQLGAPSAPIPSQSWGQSSLMAGSGSSGHVGPMELRPQSLTLYRGHAFCTRTSADCRMMERGFGGQRRVSLYLSSWQIQLEGGDSVLGPQWSPFFWLLLSSPGSCSLPPMACTCPPNK